MSLSARAPGTDTPHSTLGCGSLLVRGRLDMYRQLEAAVGAGGHGVGRLCFGFEHRCVAHACLGDIFECPKPSLEIRQM